MFHVEPICNLYSLCASAYPRPLVEALETSPLTTVNGQRGGHQPRQLPRHLPNPPFPPEVPAPFRTRPRPQLSRQMLTASSALLLTHIQRNVGAFAEGPKKKKGPPGNAHLKNVTVRAPVGSEQIPGKGPRSRKEPV